MELFGQLHAKLIAVAVLKPGDVRNAAFHILKGKFLVEGIPLDGNPTTMEFITANAFDWLRQASDGGVQSDVVVLDPPAFTKSRDSLAQALKGYKEINLRAMKLIRSGGILVTASCSYHMSETDFIAVVAAAAQDVRRFARIMEIRGQGPDHPMLPGSPESRYLKCLILTVE